MNLTVHDAARVLSVSEKTIYRWIRAGALPAYRLQEQYRFNRFELLDWATARRLPVKPEIFAEPESAAVALPTLGEALRVGGIHYRLPGATVDEALAALVAVLPLGAEVDRDFLLRVLRAREALAPTSLGHGLAMPHVRNPVVLHVDRPLVAVCFLERPVAWQALDGAPVTVLLPLLSPTLRLHLHLQRRLAFLAGRAEFRRALLAVPGRDTLAALVARWEDRLEDGEARRGAGGRATGAGPETAR